ncbi:hypothetical protein [Variovorax sp. W6]|uniref:hypothetical protein n=1 Tax=Variovorax sp. W6 TaxID=3093895 RepID=UPI003D806948
MKNFNSYCTLIAAALALIGCASRLPATDVPATAIASTQTTVTSAQTAMAFETICLKTAPSFGGAVDAAKSLGITEFSELDSARFGRTKDNSLGVQIELGIECAIITPSQADRTLSLKFGAAIARFAHGHAPGRFPVAIVVDGQPFIFQHDRQSGEALVMLKPDSTRSADRK